MLLNSYPAGKESRRAALRRIVPLVLVLLLLAGGYFLWIQPAIAGKAAQRAFDAAQKEFDGLAAEELGRDVANACRSTDLDAESRAILTLLPSLELSKAERKRIRDLDPSSLSDEDRGFLHGLRQRFREILEPSVFDEAATAPSDPPKIDDETVQRALLLGRLLWLDARASETVSVERLRHAMARLAAIRRVRYATIGAHWPSVDESLQLLTDLARVLARVSRSTEDLAGLPIPLTPPADFATKFVCPMVHWGSEIAALEQPLVDREPAWNRTRARATALAARAGLFAAFSRALRESRSGPVSRLDEAAISRELSRYPRSIRTAVGTSFIASSIGIPTYLAGAERSDAVASVLLAGVDVRREALRRGSYEGLDHLLESRVAHTSLGPEEVRFELRADGGARVSLPRLAESESGARGRAPRFAELVDWHLPPI